MILAGGENSLVEERLFALGGDVAMMRHGDCAGEVSVHGLQRAELAPGGASPAPTKDGRCSGQFEDPVWWVIRGNFGVVAE